MPSRELRLSQKAASDIRTILRYTVKTWGNVQREKMARELFVFFDSICAFPAIGRVEIWTGDEVRSIPFNVYIITYVVETESVTILRIQHQRVKPSPVSLS